MSKTIISSVITHHLSQLNKERLKAFNIALLTESPVFILFSIWIKKVDISFFLRISVNCVSHCSHTRSLEVTRWRRLRVGPGTSHFQQFTLTSSQNTFCHTFPSWEQFLNWSFSSHYRTLPCPPGDHGGTQRENREDFIFYTKKDIQVEI